MAINLGHRWAMRSNFQHLNGHDALFNSARQNIFWKCDLNLTNICFRLSIWPNGHRESQKYEFVKCISRTNEATGLIVLSSDSAQIILGFASRCLFGPGRTWTSSQKLVPAPLILFGASPSCTNFGLLVHVLPGPNKQHAFESIIILSSIRGQNN